MIRRFIMCEFIGKNRFRVFALSISIALFGSFVFAKPDPKLVKEEDGFYYGYGKGSTKETAAFTGKKDLIETALTTIVRASNPKAPRINVSDESVNNRLAELKPYTKDKKELNVAYRMKVADWDKLEKEFANKLRASISPRYEALSSKSPAEKINESMAILTILADNGETELLTVQEGATELFSRRIEAICEDIVKNLVITMSAPDGFISPETQISVKVTDKAGKAVSGLTLKAYWEVSSLLASASEAQEVVSTIKTDSKGTASVEYPVAAEYKNKPVTLTVSTAFALSAQASKAMKKFDKDSAVDARYIHCEDFNANYKFVDIEAGEFNAGAVAQDTTAGKKEATHKATTEAYAMAVTPVTNAEYAAYLHVTRSDSVPEYFENSDYNQDKQPVVGITYNDAEAYAAWLSSQTGAKYRLPTEEEWEKAARAGNETIYPWGDEAPNKAKCANFKGNKQFKFPSPVGSFEKGNNAWGLSDMAGNVWEWTTTDRTENADEESTMRVVKGGSWMDGPKDLRISNYRSIEGQNVSPDVGFRLVKEVSK